MRRCPPFLFLKSEDSAVFYMKKKLKITSIAAASVAVAGIAAVASINAKQPVNAASEYTMKYKLLATSSDGSTRLDLDSVSHSRKINAKSWSFFSGAVTMNADVDLSSYAQSIKGDNSDIIAVEPDSNGNLWYVYTYEDGSNSMQTKQTSDGKWNYQTAVILTPQIYTNNYVGYPEYFVGRENAIGDKFLSNDEVRTESANRFGKVMHDNAGVYWAAVNFLKCTSNVNMSVNGYSDLSSWSVTSSVDSDNKPVVTLTSPKNDYKIEIKGTVREPYYESTLGFNNNGVANTNNIKYSPDVSRDASWKDSDISVASNSNTSFSASYATSMVHLLHQGTSETEKWYGSNSYNIQGNVPICDITVYQAVNEAPTVTIDHIDNQHYDTTGHNVAVSGTASDADGDTLSVDLYLNSTSGTKLATVPVDSSGRWTATINTKGMSLNSNPSIIAVASDGKATSTAARTSFRIVNAAPTVTINPISNMVAGSASNVAVSGRWTDTDTNPKDTITGTLSINGKSLGSVTINADGTWTGTIPAAEINAIKEHTVQVTITDNIASPVSANTKFTVTNAAPTITPAKATDTIVAGSGYEFDVTLADANSGQTLTYSYSVNGGAFKTLGTATSNGSSIAKSGNVIPASELSTGSNIINLKVSDGFAEGTAVITLTNAAQKISVSAEDLPDQQFTTESNVVVFKASRVSNYRFSGTTEIKFNGKTVPSGNIQMESVETIHSPAMGSSSTVAEDTYGVNYSISVDLAGLDVKNGYTLEIICSGDGLSAPISDTGTVNIVNTAPTITASVPSDKVVYASDKSVSVPVTMNDINIGQNMSVEYRVDGGNWTNANIDYVNAGTKNASVSVPINDSMAGKTIRLQFRTFDGIEYGYDNGPQNNGYPLTIKEDASLIVRSAPDQQFTTNSNIVTFECEAEGDDLTATATFNGRPVSASNISSIDSNGKFTVKVDTAGLDVSDTSYVLNVTVADGTSDPVSNSGTVRIINTAPTINATVPSNKTVYISEPSITVPVTITDPNIGQDMSVSYRVDDGSWVDAKIDYVNTGSKNGSVSIPITKDMAGKTVKLYFRAYDSIEYGYDNGPQGNGYPIAVKSDASLIVPSAPDQQFTTDPNLVTFECQATGENLSITATFNGTPVSPANISPINDAGKFTITIDTANLGVSDQPYNLNVTVSDGTSAPVSDSGTVKVVNTAPVIKAAVDTSKEVYVSNGQIIVPVKVTDPNIGQGMSIAYSIDGSDWINTGLDYINQGNQDAEIAIPLTKEMIGNTIRLRFRAFDGIEYGYDNALDDVGYPLVVLGAEEEVNVIVGSAPNQQYTTNKNLVVFECSATGEDLTIEAVFNGIPVPPAQISPIGSDGKFTVTVDTASLEVSSTPYNLEVTASDEYGSVAEDFGTVKVVNTPPSIKSTSKDKDSHYNPEDTIHFSVDTNDINIGQTISLDYSVNGSSWTSLDTEYVTAGVSNISEISLPAGLFASDGEPIKITFRAFDGIEYSTSPEHTITVKKLEIPKENRAPEITITNIPSTTEEGKAIPVVVESTEKDVGDTINVYRSIDGGEFVLVETYISDGIKHIVNDRLPASLSVGKHEITYKNSDQGNLSDTDKKSFEIVAAPKVENNPPELYIEDMPESVQAGRPVDITLKVKDIDEGQEVWVYYELDNGKKVLVDKFTSKGKTKTIDLTLEDLDIGDHKIKFYAVDEMDAYSNDDGDVKIKDFDKYKPSKDKANAADFEVNNTPPTAEIVDCPSKVQVGDDVNVHITSKDLDAGQKVNVYYMVDGSWPTKINEYTSNGSAVPNEFTVSNLAPGTHTISIFAEDECGARSDDSGNALASGSAGGYNPLTQVTVVVEGPINNAPTVDFLKQETEFFVGDDINLKIAANDIDKGQKVTTYYKVEDENSKTIATFTSTGDPKNQTIKLGKLAAGKYTVSFWAIDELGARSDSAGDTVIDPADIDNISKAIITVKEKPVEEVKTGVESDDPKNNKGIFAIIAGAVSMICGGIAIITSKFSITKNKR